eukprot:s866_g2.t2
MVDPKKRSGKVTASEVLRKKWFESSDARKKLVLEMVKKDKYNPTDHEYLVDVSCGKSLEKESEDKLVDETDLGDHEREHAAESAAEVLENALRVQGRLEATLRKLAALSPSKGFINVMVVVDASKPGSNRCLVLAASFTPLRYHKASDKRACHLAHGFYQELCSVGKEDEAPSSKFLRKLSQLHSTGHENRLESVLEDFGLQAPIPVSYIQVQGLQSAHPVLKPKDVLETMAKFNKLDCFLHGHSPKDFSNFWEKFRALEPENLVFIQHGKRLEQVVPIMIHLDEGTGQKKKPLLILQYHSVLGLGSRRAPDLNFTGSTFKTRLLYTTMPAKTYGKQTKKKEIIQSLFEAWARDLMTLFTDGFDYETADGKVSKLFAACVGCKGDWPALNLAGNLERHFGRVEKEKASSRKPCPGICHLCRAGMPKYPWHEYGPKAKWNLDRGEVPAPWKPNNKPPLLTLCLNPRSPESFFKIDCFHTLHKGCFADLAASAAAF